MLLVNERRQRITEADTVDFLRFVSALPILIDYAPDDGSILRLGRQYRLTVYDSSYLELALREAVPPASLDKELAAVARREVSD